METCTIRKESDGFKIFGLVNFDTVTKLYKQGTQLLEGLDRIVIDFSNVTYADSSGIALLLYWLRIAKLEGKSCQFANLPRQLVEMANVCEVMPFLQEHMITNN
jgi:phospholipid transport system transporter-binding protein